MLGFGTLYFSTHILFPCMYIWIYVWRDDLCVVNHLWSHYILYIHICGGSDIYIYKIHHITLALQRTHLKIGYISTKTPLNTKLKRAVPNFQIRMGQKERSRRHHLSKARLLNKRTEIISKCRHENKYQHYLKSYYIRQVFFCRFYSIFCRLKIVTMLETGSNEIIF